MLITQLTNLIICGGRGAAIHPLFINSSQNLGYLANRAFNPEEI
jgi:hypothetical protein